MPLPFTLLTALAAPMLEPDIDTDIIIPSREMRGTGKTGLAAGLFANRRYLAKSRTPDPTFILNQPRYRTAAILLAGANFGCGSSREHAVWALAEYGIRCVIAPSFSPIFAANAMRGGVLPLTLPATAVTALAAVEAPLTIDLPAQTVAAEPRAYNFAIDPEAKAMLIAGGDAIDLTLHHRAAITAWTVTDRIARPWVWLMEPHAAAVPEPQIAPVG